MSEENLVEALEAVANRGSGRGLTVLLGEEAEEHISFTRLHHDAGRVAGGLRSAGARRGERVAIALPTCVDFARSFFGVLAAGAVPVPVPPPVRFGSFDAYISRTAAILRCSNVRLVVVNRSTAGLFDALSGGAPPPTAAGPPGTVRVEPLEVGALMAADLLWRPLPPSEPALVQYTSGTSDAPKGVVLTGRNLLANIESIVHGIDMTRDDVVSNWLPLFHDLGLIGTFLTPVLRDIETYLLPTDRFLRDPESWARSISDHGATLTTAPNSGYLHLLRRISDETLGELDLSRWRLALNGAEAVDPDMQRRFHARFAPAGLRPDVFLPVYGLAEATLAVAFPPANRAIRVVHARRDQLAEGRLAEVPPGHGTARELVSVGSAVLHTVIRLADEHGKTIDTDGLVGEIQVRGASVTRGYENNPNATEQALGGGWLATGDLGVRQHGELFIVGRTSEKIILFGRTLYATDLETIARAALGPRGPRVLAGTIFSAQGEQLILMVESAGAGAEQAAAVRSAIGATFGVTPHEVVFVPKGGLPRTTSGKLRRHGLDDVYRARVSPPTEGQKAGTHALTE